MGARVSTVCGWPSGGRCHGGWSRRTAPYLEMCRTKSEASLKSGNATMVSMEGGWWCPIRGFWDSTVGSLLRRSRGVVSARLGTRVCGLSMASGSWVTGCQIACPIRGSWSVENASSTRASSMESCSALAGRCRQPSSQSCRGIGPFLGGSEAYLKPPVVPSRVALVTLRATTRLPWQRLLVHTCRIHTKSTRPTDRHQTTTVGTDHQILFTAARCTTSIVDIDRWLAVHHSAYRPPYLLCMSK